jgi:hypothetical protein
LSVVSCSERRSTSIATDEPPANPEAYRLAFEEGVRASESQNVGLEGLRTRAGVLMTAAAVVVGF